jgi:hypothetical protein
MVLQLNFLPSHFLHPLSVHSFWMLLIKWKSIIWNRCISIVLVAIFDEKDQLPVVPGLVYAQDTQRGQTCRGPLLTLLSPCPGLTQDRLPVITNVVCALVNGLVSAQYKLSGLHSVDRQVSRSGTEYIKGTVRRDFLKMHFFNDSILLCLKYCVFRSK